MKIFFSGYHNPYYETVTEYITRAINGLGHDVTVYNDRQHIIHGRLSDHFKWLWKLDLELINICIAMQAIKSKPDLAIITGGGRVMAKTIQLLRKRGIKTVLWTTDPPRLFDVILQAAPYYDHIFCQGTEAIEILEVNGIRGAHWLPVGCDIGRHHPVHLSDHDRISYGSDLVFVGSYYPERAEMFEGLTDFNLAIWGPGWQQLPKDSPLKKVIRKAHTTPPEWLKIYCASKIVLATHYHDPKNRFPVHQASPRVFEAMACGAFVLCDRQRDIFTLFRDGVHLAGFDDRNDLIGKAKYYLEHEGERTNIARNGVSEAILNHTYRRRLEELFSHIN